MGINHNKTPLPKPPKVWKRKDGSIVSCISSVKELEMSWHEIASQLQEAYEDAVLLGVSKAEFKRAYMQLISELECDYDEKQDISEKC